MFDCDVSQGWLMKVFPRRTNQTAVRCLLDGPTLEALLTEAAAKAAGLDLSAPNVKVERVQVEEPDHSQHRRKATAIVDLVVIHDASAVADWPWGFEPPPRPPKPLPPPPPTTEFRPGARPAPLGIKLCFGFLVLSCVAAVIGMFLEVQGMK